MSDKVARIYGYAVCLVAVITFLITSSSFVGSFFDLSDPLHAKGYRYVDKSLASFETYKMDILKSVRSKGEESEPAYIPDDETIRGMFEAAKDDRISTVTLDARRSMTVNGMLGILSVVLFAFHWFWMRRLGKNQS